MNIVEIEYVDHGAQGEYSFFGKVVARSDVRGMTLEQREAEVAEMLAQLGEHIVPREVIEISAAL